MRPDEGPARPKTPRWVIVFAVVGIVLVIGIVAVLVFGGGQHGPGSHAPTVDVLEAPSPPARHGPTGLQEQPAAPSIATRPVSSWQAGAIDDRI